MGPMIAKEMKYNLHYGKVWGDVLLLPHDTNTSCSVVKETWDLHLGQGTWDLHLKQVLAAIRFNASEATDYLPYYLLYNCDVLLPTDNLLKP